MWWGRPWGRPRRRMLCASLATVLSLLVIFGLVAYWLGWWLSAPPVAYSHISDVEYFIDEVEILQHPLEPLHMSRLNNFGCRNVTKSVALSVTLESTWNMQGRPAMLGAATSITAQIPFLCSGVIDFMPSEKTLQFNRGTTMSVLETLEPVSVQLTVPPKRSCPVLLAGRKLTADIPFTARLSQTFYNGETRWTSVEGTYNAVQIGEFETVLDSCEPVADAKPCP